MSDEADRASTGASFADDPRGIRLHEGLLARDPEAIERLWDYFPPLVDRALFKLFSSVPDREGVASDLALRVIENMMERPERFDPERGKSLSGYLRMDLDGDLLNWLERFGRQPRLLSMDQPVGGDDDDVGNATIGGNIPSEDPTPDDVYLRGEGQDRIREVRERVALLAEEQAVFDLQYQEGVKQTGVFAEALQISHLPEKDQAREVQKIKDRIAKRLRRMDEGDL